MPWVSANVINKAIYIKSIYLYGVEQCLESRSGISSAQAELILHKCMHAAYIHKTSTIQRLAMQVQLILEKMQSNAPVTWLGACIHPRISLHIPMYPCKYISIYRDRWCIFSGHLLAVHTCVLAAATSFEAPAPKMPVKHETPSPRSTGCATESWHISKYIKNYIAHLVSHLLKCQ